MDPLVASDDRNGRPPLNKTRRGAAQCVSVRLDDITYDGLYALHRVTGEDISAMIRRAIEAHVLPERRTTRR